MTQVEELIAFSKKENIQLTVVGPEAPLAAGIVDAFRDAGLKIFGPTRAAAQLEASKDFAKSFMTRHGIPTAAHRTFERADEAKAYVAERGAPIVVKADGLAAGKGVVVAASVPEAHAAIDRMMTEKSLGAAGARLVVEQFLEGEEASFIVMSDGAHVLTLATSQDHKRLRDGDKGPNTGGMGAYSPAPVVTPKIHARVMREIILPTIQGMAQDGAPYVGFLYAGLMIDKERHAEDAGVQLPPGRPRDPADHRAAEIRPARSDRACARRHARAGARRNGTAAPPSAWWSPPTAIRRSRARATSSPGCRYRIPTCACSTPARGAKARPSSPAAGACSA